MTFFAIFFLDFYVMPERIVEQCIDGDWVCLGCVTDENA